METLVFDYCSLLVATYLALSIWDCWLVPLSKIIIYYCFACMLPPSSLKVEIAEDAKWKV